MLGPAEGEDFIIHEIKSDVDPTRWAAYCKHCQWHGEGRARYTRAVSDYLLHHGHAHSGNGVSDRG